MRPVGLLALLVLSPRAAPAQVPQPASRAVAPWRQTQADDYTRYELLAPATHSFRILYDVTATTPGAPSYFNTLRKGSEHTVAAVYDLRTGDTLHWTIVDGAHARAAGMQNASPDEEYLQVRLARPVPDGGEGRVRIDKTYRDTASYFERNGDIVFRRSLGIPRNAVVLPVGYELARVTFPSQIATEPDGRIRVSFMNGGAGAVLYEVVGRPLPPGTARPTPLSEDVLSGPVSSSPGATQRAFQDREIVYFLAQPETHSFHLYHDYTESRAGVDHYVNVVRTGSTVSNPSARILDTGQTLKVETLTGAEITQRGIDIGEPVNAKSQAAVAWFDPVPPGGSVRLRIEETYTDSVRYGVRNGMLVWDRVFGRPRNAVVLPAGWYVTASSIPGTVTQTDDGRVRLDFWNDRPDEIRVFITAERR